MLNHVMHEDESSQRQTAVQMEEDCSKWDLLDTMRFRETHKQNIDDKMTRKERCNIILHMCPMNKNI